jgi:hypothetical protein
VQVVEWRNSWERRPAFAPCHFLGLACSIAGVLLALLLLLLLLAWWWENHACDTLYWRSVKFRIELPKGSRSSITVIPSHDIIPKIDQCVLLTRLVSCR